MDKEIPLSDNQLIPIQDQQEVLNVLDTSAQNSHWGCMAAIILGLHLFVDIHILLWVAVSLTGLAAIKEFYYDQQFENPVVRGSNLRDFTFYFTGIWGAMILIFVSKHLPFTL